VQGVRIERLSGQRFSAVSVQLAVATEVTPTIPPSPYISIDSISTLDIE
jgi:hypothetical protein